MAYLYFHGSFGVGCRITEHNLSRKDTLTCNQWMFNISRIALFSYLILIALITKTNPIFPSYRAVLLFRSEERTLSKTPFPAEHLGSEMNSWTATAALIYEQTMVGCFGGVYFSTCMLINATLVFEFWTFILIETSLNLWKCTCICSSVCMNVWFFLTLPCLRLWLHLSVGAKPVSDWKINKQTITSEISSKS